MSALKANADMQVTWQQIGLWSSEVTLKKGLAVAREPFARTGDHLRSATWNLVGKKTVYCTHLIHYREGYPKLFVRGLSQTIWILPIDGKNPIEPSHFKGLNG